VFRVFRSARLFGRFEAATAQSQLHCAAGFFYSMLVLNRKICDCDTNSNRDFNPMPLADKEASLMILLALDDRRKRRNNKAITRARFSSLTLKRLCQLERITPAWIERVNAWLLMAGWTLVDEGTTYGAVKVDVVENWPRAISKHLRTQMAEVKEGTFDFTSLNRLLRKDVWKTTSHLSAQKAKVAR